MKKSSKITALVSIPLLLIAVIAFFNTVGYLGPKAPKLDHEAEFKKLAAQYYGGLVGDWSSAQSLFDEFEAATMPGDDRAAAAVFAEYESQHRKYLTLDEQAKALGPWTHALDSARFRQLAQVAFESHAFTPEFSIDSDMRTDFRRLTRAIRLDAQHAIATDELHEAIHAVHALMDIARICEAHQSFINRLVAIAIQASADTLVFRLLDSGLASSSQLDDLAGLYRDIDPPDPALVFEGEWIWSNQLIDSAFDESLLIPSSRSALLFKLRQAYDKMIEQIRAGTSDPAWWDEYQSSLTPLYLPIDILLPAFDMFRSSLSQAQTTRDAVRLALAIELHIAAHSTPPQSLEQLVPEFLPEIPTDSVSKTPFAYRLTTDNHRGYTLYSLGSDTTDDNGSVFNPERPFDALGSRRPGDAVFIPHQRPREKEATPETSFGP